MNAAEIAATKGLVGLALAEDVGEVGDVTSIATIPMDNYGTADFVARTAGVIAGLTVAEMVAAAVDRRLKIEAAITDGTTVAAGTRIATITGPMRALLTAERTALNFMQRLSGVATLTRKYVDAVAGQSQVLDTRKTTPGWRLLDKYAVRMGGGHNHRVGLYDGVLIKDNHLAALGGGAKAIQMAVTAARAQAPKLPVEVEVDRWEQFEAALACQPDIILLDNMTVDQLAKCVAHRNAVASGIRLEASGGVNLTTIGAIAKTGVDRISVGAITHSAPAMDIALDYRV